VLKEALTQLWEQAQAKKFTAISTLELRLYDAGDGFRLLGLVGAIQKASKRVTMQGSYATAEGSELYLEFSGTIQDAQPVKDFLEPQLRAAVDKNVQVIFQVFFTEGLALQGNEPAKLTERLSRFGTGAAYVAATAKGAA
jgi:hypothetical protein